METKELKNKDGKLWIKDDILYSSFRENLVIDLEVAKTFIKMRHDISDGKNQYWCYFAAGVKYYPKEARDYSAIHGQEMLHACACVVNSHFTKFLFNAFNRINKPSIPFKAFRTEKEAVNWLRKLKSENESKGIF